MSESREKELTVERDQLRLDLVAFTKAYDLIRQRIQESVDGPNRSIMLHQWSGTSAVCGSLELSIHAIQRTIDEYDKVIEQERLKDVPILPFCINNVPDPPPPKRPPLKSV